VFGDKHPLSGQQTPSASTVLRLRCLHSARMLDYSIPAAPSVDPGDVRVCTPHAFDTQKAHSPPQQLMTTDLLALHPNHGLAS
jgi:hypothetical protein